MAGKVVKVSALQQRRDTVKNWEQKNPILLDGEQITVVFDDNVIRHKTGYGGRKYLEIPFDNQYVVQEIESVLLANAWVNGSQTIGINEIKSDHSGTASLSESCSDAQYEAAAEAGIRVVSHGDKTITISCINDVPTIDIPIVITLLNADSSSGGSSSSTASQSTGIAHIITLPVSNWNNLEQTVMLQGISGDESSQLINPIPASKDFNAYAAAEIHVSQAVNQLTFTCATVPTQDLTVYVVVQNLIKGGAE